VGEDGPTHHGVFAVGFLRQVPGMKILCPACHTELREMLRWAVLANDGPIAVRYPRGGEGSFRAKPWDPANSVESHGHGRDAAIITYGSLINQAMDAAERLREKGIEVTVCRLTSLNPVPANALEGLCSGIRNFVILEEATAGVAESIACALYDRMPGCKVAIRDLGDDFTPHGDMNALYKSVGLDADSITKLVCEVVHNEE
jgi:1-deoxy-D-xylulose-5-phosphate synthase